MNTTTRERDLYEVLGVPRDVSDTALKKAYYGLAKKYHPDMCPGDKEAEARFKEAANAYQVLSDSELRARYDRHGLDGIRRGGPPGAGPDGAGSPFEGFKSVDDVLTTFGNLFGEFFAQRTARSPRGADLHHELHLTFQEAVWGTHKEVRVTRTASCPPCGGTGAARGSRAETCLHCQGKGQIAHAQGFFMVQTTCTPCQGRGRTTNFPCHTCQGRGIGPETSTLSLTIPPGVSEGQTLRVSHRGEHAPGGTSGDLYVLLHVTKDARFTREKEDITSEVPISFARAALGGEVEIDTLDEDCQGTTILELTPGTQPGDLIVRRGQGIPHLSGQGRGDHLIRFRVEVPKKLTEEQATILRTFAEASGEDLGEKSQRPKRRRSK